jgi:hypothetical protein
VTPPGPSDGPHADLIDALTATPVLIRDLTNGAKDSVLRSRPTKDEWSATEVLAHLRACADVWGGCIETLLADERQRTIRAVSPRAWIDRTDYPDQPFDRSLRAFTSQRKRLVKTLSSLREADWSRDAVVTGAGKPLTRSVYDYAARLIRHERPHVRQIGRAVDANTSAAVHLTHHS